MHEPEDYNAWQYGQNEARLGDPNIPNSFNSYPTHEFPNPVEGPSTPPNRLVIKLPPMTANGMGVGAAGLRRSSRRTTSLGTENSLPSGSEYHESDKSMEVDPDGDADAEGEEEVPSPEQKLEYTTTGRGRRILKKTYRESDDDGEDPNIALDAIFADDSKVVKREQFPDDEDDDEEDVGPRRTKRLTRTAKLDGFIISDEEGGGGGRYSTRSRNKKPAPKSKPSGANGRSRSDAQISARAARLTRRSARTADEEDGYVDEEQSPSSPDGEFDDAPHTSSDLDAEPEADGEADRNGDGGEVEQDGKPYALRQRAKINYAIPPPLEEMRPANTKGAGAKGGRNGAGGRNGGARPGARRGPGWSASGAELGRWMGMPGNDSVSLPEFYRL